MNGIDGASTEICYVDQSIFNAVIDRIARAPTVAVFPGRSVISMQPVAKPTGVATDAGQAAFAAPERAVRLPQPRSPINF